VPQVNVSNRVMVSIVVPYKDRFHYLDDLLSSIPDYEGVEVILVDDGSSNPFEPKVEWSSTTLVMLSNPSGNRYAGATRNTGIRNASGEFLFFADSDDRILAGGFLSAIESLKGGSSCDVLIGRVTSFTDEGRVGRRHIRYNWLARRYEMEKRQDVLLRHSVPWGKFFRREFVLRHRCEFDATRVSNDLQFSARVIIAAPRVETSLQRVYAARESHQSLSQDYSLHAVEERIQTLLRYNDLIRSYGCAHIMVPSYVWLRRIWRRHPVRAIELALRTVGRKQPVFWTRWSVTNPVRMWIEG
jgi:glycosyltransferase involved in cell wall biosynthesis